MSSNVFGYLVVIKKDGNTDGSRFAVTNNTVIIGRGSVCDIRFSRPNVALKQCAINFKSDGEVFVENLDPTSLPVTIEGVLILNKRILPGQTFAIDTRRFRFEQSEEQRLCQISQLQRQTTLKLLMPKNLDEKKKRYTEGDLITSKIDPTTTAANRSQDVNIGFSTEVGSAELETKSLECETKSFESETKNYEKNETKSLGPELDIHENNRRKSLELESQIYKKDQRNEQRKTENIEKSPQFLENSSPNLSLKKRNRRSYSTQITKTLEVPLRRSTRSRSISGIISQTEFTPLTPKLNKTLNSKVRTPRGNKRNEIQNILLHNIVKNNPTATDTNDISNISKLSTIALNNTSIKSISSENVTSSTICDDLHNNITLDNEIDTYSSKTNLSATPKDSSIALEHENSESDNSKENHTETENVSKMIVNDDIIRTPSKILGILSASDINNSVVSLISKRNKRDNLLGNVSENGDIINESISSTRSRHSIHEIHKTEEKSILSVSQKNQSENISNILGTPNGMGNLTKKDNNPTSSKTDDFNETYFSGCKSNILLESTESDIFERIQHSPSDNINTSKVFDNVQNDFKFSTPYTVNKNMTSTPGRLLRKSIRFDSETSEILDEQFDIDIESTKNIDENRTNYTSIKNISNIEILKDSDTVERLQNIDNSTLDSSKKVKLFDTKNESHQFKNNQIIDQEKSINKSLKSPYTRKSARFQAKDDSKIENQSNAADKKTKQGETSIISPRKSKQFDNNVQDNLQKEKLMNLASKDKQLQSQNNSIIETEASETTLRKSKRFQAENGFQIEYQSDVIGNSIEEKVSKRESPKITRIRNFIVEQTIEKNTSKISPRKSKRFQLEKESIMENEPDVAGEKTIKKDTSMISPRKSNPLQTKNEPEIENESNIIEEITIERDPTIISPRKSKRFQTKKKLEIGNESNVIDEKTIDKDTSLISPRKSNRFQTENESEIENESNVIEEKSIKETSIISPRKSKGFQTENEPDIENESNVIDEKTIDKDASMISPRKSNRFQLEKESIMENEPDVTGKKIIEKDTSMISPRKSNPLQTENEPEIENESNIIEEKIIENDPTMISPRKIKRFQTENEQDIENESNVIDKKTIDKDISMISPRKSNRFQTENESEIENESNVIDEKTIGKDASMISPRKSKRFQLEKESVMENEPDVTGKKIIEKNTSMISQRKSNPLQTENEPEIENASNVIEEKTIEKDPTMISPRKSKRFQTENEQDIDNESNVIDKKTIDKDISMISPRKSSRFQTENEPDIENELNVIEEKTIEKDTSMISPRKSNRSKKDNESTKENESNVIGEKTIEEDTSKISPTKSNRFQTENESEIENESNGIEEKSIEKETSIISPRKSKRFQTENEPDIENESNVIYEKTIDKDASMISPRKSKRFQTENEQDIENESNVIDKKTIDKVLSMVSPRKSSRFQTENEPEIENERNVIEEKTIEKGTSMISPRKSNRSKKDNESTKENESNVIGEKTNEEDTSKISPRKSNRFQTENESEIENEYNSIEEKLIEKDTSILSLQTENEPEIENEFNVIGEKTIDNKDPSMISPRKSNLFQKQNESEIENESNDIEEKSIEKETSMISSRKSKRFHTENEPEIENESNIIDEKTIDKDASMISPRKSKRFQTENEPEIKNESNVIEENTFQKNSSLISPRKSSRLQTKNESNVIEEKTIEKDTSMVSSRKSNRFLTEIESKIENRSTIIEENIEEEASKSEPPIIAQRKSERFKTENKPILNIQSDDTNEKTPKKGMSIISPRKNNRRKFENVSKVENQSQIQNQCDVFGNKTNDEKLENIINNRSKRFDPKNESHIDNNTQNMNETTFFEENLKENASIKSLNANRVSKVNNRIDDTDSIVEQDVSENKSIVAETRRSKRFESVNDSKVKNQTDITGCFVHDISEKNSIVTDYRRSKRLKSANVSENLSIIASGKRKRTQEHLEKISSSVSTRSRRSRRFNSMIEYGSLETPTRKNKRINATIHNQLDTIVNEFDEETPKTSKQNESEISKRRNSYVRIGTIQSNNEDIENIETPRALRSKLNNSVLSKSSQKTLFEQQNFSPSCSSLIPMPDEDKSYSIVSNSSNIVATPKSSFVINPAPETPFLRNIPKTFTSTPKLDIDYTQKAQNVKESIIEEEINEGDVSSDRETPKTHVKIEIQELKHQHSTAKKLRKSIQLSENTSVVTQMVKQLFKNDNVKDDTHDEDIQENSRKSRRRSKPNNSNISLNELTNVSNLKILRNTSNKLRPSELYNVNDKDGETSKNIKKIERIVEKSPKNDLTDVKGVKRLFSTPKVQKSPKNDLTDIRGVKKLLGTPQIQNSPKNDLRNVRGVKKLLGTPKDKKSPKNDLTNVKGIRKLMSTPKIQNSPKNDLTNVRGIKQLLRTPKVQNSPKNDLTHIRGIKKLLGTPKIQNLPKNDLRNVEGVRRLLSTPKNQKSPKNDLTNIVSVKELMSTPIIEINKSCKYVIIDDDDSKSKRNSRNSSISNVVKKGNNSSNDEAKKLDKETQVKVKVKTRGSNTETELKTNKEIQTHLVEPVALRNIDIKVNSPNTSGGRRKKSGIEQQSLIDLSTEVHVALNESGRILCDEKNSERLHSTAIERATRGRNNKKVEEIQSTSFNSPQVKTTRGRTTRRNQITSPSKDNKHELQNNLLEKQNSKYFSNSVRVIIDNVCRKAVDDVIDEHINIDNSNPVIVLSSENVSQNQGQEKMAKRNLEIENIIKEEQPLSPAVKRLRGRANSTRSNKNTPIKEEETPKRTTRQNKKNIEKLTTEEKEKNLEVDQKQTKRERMLQETLENKINESDSEEPKRTTRRRKIDERDNIKIDEENQQKELDQKRGRSRQTKRNIEEAIVAVSDVEIVKTLETKIKESGSEDPKRTTRRRKIDERNNIKIDEENQEKELDQKRGKSRQAKRNIEEAEDAVSGVEIVKTLETKIKENESEAPKRTIRRRKIDERDNIKIGEENQQKELEQKRGRSRQTKRNIEETEDSVSDVEIVETLENKIKESGSEEPKRTTRRRKIDERDNIKVNEEDHQKELDQINGRSRQTKRNIEEAEYAASKQSPKRTTRGRKIIQKVNVKLSEDDKDEEMADQKQGRSRHTKKDNGKYAVEDSVAVETDKKPTKAKQIATKDLDKGKKSDSEDEETHLEKPNPKRNLRRKKILQKENLMNEDEDEETHLEKRNTRSRKVLKDNENVEVGQVRTRGGRQAKKIVEKSGSEDTDEDTEETNHKRTRSKQTKNYLENSNKKDAIELKKNVETPDQTNTKRTRGRLIKKDTDINIIKESEDVNNKRKRENKTDVEEGIVKDSDVILISDDESPPSAKKSLKTQSNKEVKESKKRRRVL